jgi:hypothetical protein
VLVLEVNEAVPLGKRLAGPDQGDQVALFSVRQFDGTADERG